MIEVYVSLLNLGYVGCIKTIQDFVCAFSEGDINKLFFDLATWLSSQLGTLLRLENLISIDSEENLRSASLQETLKDPFAFLVEMSSLLKEMQCPMQQLTSDEIEDRLKSAQNKLRVIEYLIQELQAAKIKAIKLPKVEKQLQLVELEESRTAKELRELFMTLNFSKPPNDLKASKMFLEIDKRICALSQPLLLEDLIGNALFNGILTESQWFALERLYGEFYAEYRNRREMDITRASVTITSFMWNARVERISEDIMNLYNEFMRNVSVEPDVEISDILAATADMSIGEKVSSGAARKNTRGVAHNVKIFQVPDRGGRPNEQRPPPPEVPSWQPRQDPQNRNRGPFTMSTSRESPVTFAPGIDIRGGGDLRAHLTPAHLPPAHPVEVLPPMPVAGDNFAQFGNVPVVIGQHAFRDAPIIINPNVQVPPPNFQHQRGRAPQGNRGLYAGRGPFEGHGAHDNGAYGGHRGHDNANHGAYGGHGGHIDRGAYGGLGGHVDRGAYGGHRGYVDRGAYGGRGGYIDRGAYGGRGGHVDRGAYGGRGGHDDNGQYGGEGDVGRGGHADRGQYGGDGPYVGRGQYDNRGNRGGRGHVRGRQVRRVQYGGGRGNLDGFGGFGGAGGYGNN